MTQTTKAMNFRKAIVSFGAATASLTIITGQLCAVAVGGGERGGSVGHTADGDFPVIAAGKVAPCTITVRYLYTEEDTEAHVVAQAIWATPGAACFLRYIPSGGTTSAEDEHKTANAAGDAEAAGYMSAFEPLPPGEVGSSDMLRGQFTVTCERIITEAVAA